MTNLTKTLAAALLACALGAPVAAEEHTDITTVVATVNGEEITLGHLILLYARLPQQYQELPADVLFDGILNQAVDQILLAETLGDDRPAYVDMALDNEERGMLAVAAIDGLRSAAITDDAVQALYEATYADAPGSKEYNASHILVETEEAAKAVKADLDGGANFNDLAREKSTGPSGPNGGNLGWFGDGMMVKPFEEAVKSLEPGQVSDPVETQFGWHVVRLNETRIKEAPTLESVREELTAKVAELAVQERLTSLRENGDLSVPETGAFDPKLITRTELLD